jgi:hypothetical protein
VNLALVLIATTMSKTDLFGNRPNGGPPSNLASISTSGFGKNHVTWFKYKAHTLRHHFMPHPNRYRVVAMLGAEVEEFCEGLFRGHGIIRLAYAFHSDS